MNFSLYISSTWVIMPELKAMNISLSVNVVLSPILSKMLLNSARHIKGFYPGLTFILEFFL